MSIAISFTPGLDIAESRVRASGRQLHPITPDALADLGYDPSDVSGITDGGQSFHLTNWAYQLGFHEPLDGIRLAQEKDVGRSDIETVDWHGRSVPRSLAPAAIWITPLLGKPGKIDSIFLEPKLIGHEVYGPNATDSEATATLSGKVQESLTVGLAVGKTHAISFDVNVEMGAGPIKAGAGSSISETVSVEHSRANTKSEEYDLEGSISFKVSAGKVIAAVCTVSEGIISATVPVVAQLTGDVLCWVNQSFGNGRQGTVAVPLESWPVRKLQAVYLAQIQGAIYGDESYRDVECRSGMPADVEAAAGTDKPRYRVYPK